MYELYLQDALLNGDEISAALQRPLTPESADLVLRLAQERERLLLAPLSDQPPCPAVTDLLARLAEQQCWIETEMRRVMDQLRVEQRSAMRIRDGVRSTGRLFQNRASAAHFNQRL